MLDKVERKLTLFKNKIQITNFPYLSKKKRIKKNNREIIVGDMLHLALHIQLVNLQLPITIYEINVILYIDKILAFRMKKMT